MVWANGPLHRHWVTEIVEVFAILFTVILKISQPDYAHAPFTDTFGTKFRVLSSKLRVPSSEFQVPSSEIFMINICQNLLGIRSCLFAAFFI